MDELRFSWDPRKAKSNLRKHRVSFEEAEDRFVILGLSARPRLLVVCHCLPEEGHMVRIISARRAN